MAYEFLKKLFGTQKDGEEPKRMSYTELEAALDADKKIQVVDLKAGGYVAKEKFDAKSTELDGVKQQLADANTEIQSYKDMDIEGIKQKAANWEQKYNTDTQALNDKLRKQEIDHQMDRYLDTAGIKPGAMYRNFVRAALEAKEFKLDGGKFLGADDYIKELKENPDYKDAFIAEKPAGDPTGNPQAGIGTDGPAAPPTNAPFFAASTQSQQEPSKGDLFNFGFTGVRKHD